jgi:lysozyme
MAIDIPLMQQELLRDEGIVYYVYDDANGNRIIPGYTLVGHPTIGVGRCLDLHGLTSNESMYLLGNDIATCADALATFPWFAGLDAVRQRAVVNMAFQMGVTGVLSFKAMISRLAVHDYDGASLEGADSRWARVQTPSRAARVLKQLRTGQGM